MSKTKKINRMPFSTKIIILFFAIIISFSFWGLSATINSFTSIDLIEKNISEIKKDKIKINTDKETNNNRSIDDQTIKSIQNNIEKTDTANIYSPYKEKIIFNNIKTSEGKFIILYVKSGNWKNSYRDLITFSSEGYNRKSCNSIVSKMFTDFFIITVNEIIVKSNGLGQVDKNQLTRVCNKNNNKVSFNIVKRVNLSILKSHSYSNNKDQAYHNDKDLYKKQRERMIDAGKVREACIKPSKLDDERCKAKLFN